jgi:cytochrome c
MAAPYLAFARPLQLPVPASPLLVKVADVQHGEQIFQSRCSVCHTLQAGAPNKFGPNLHGLFGRHAGSLPGYNYSSAMRGAGAMGLVWSAVTLDPYLENPHKAVPGDKMPFPGIPGEQDRQAVIAYLEQATR